ncbi:hypothetical protein PIROE2DRAFT_38828, partial [Piromyces sp. E2]
LLSRPDIDINLQDDKGCTALMYALKSQNKEVIELLLNHPDINVNIKNYKEGYTVWYKKVLMIW